VKKLAELFWELFKISLFVIGGGYSIIAVADSVFSRKGWIREDELLEHLPVFQMVPGLIATHTAVYVGNRVAGPLGSLVGVVAVALPSVVIFTLVSVWYRAIPLDNPWLNSAFVGLRAALTGIIAATIVKAWRKFMTDAFAYALLVAGLVSLALLHVPVAAVLVASAACGVMSLAGKDNGLRARSVAWLPLLLFLQYGALCFGGGFVLVPMYLADFVGANAPHLQLTGEEFSNIMAVSQMTPGPIGVNCATFFGFRLAGVAGAIVASALLLLPGSVAAWFVFRSLDRFQSSRLVQGLLRGIRPASIALMLVALVAFAEMTVLGADRKFHTIGAILVIITATLFMKKKINVILLILLCAGAATALRAEDVSSVQFPDADTVTLCETEYVEYKPDGSSVSVSEAWSRVLTERGRREDSELRLGYNRRYSTARILYVGIIDELGVEREVDVSGTTKDMTDNSSLAENIVDPQDRELVCTIPGLKVGEALHIKVERTIFKSRVKDQWSDLVICEWTHPILKSVYTVRAPKERPIKRRAIRHPLGNVTEEVHVQEDGSTLYTYTTTNSPRMFPEPDMPPQWNVVQSIHLSTASDWREISRWYWDVCQPHLEKTNAAITNKVEELGRDMRAIFKFVSQDIRYMGLTMEDTAPGYAPHDVDITFDNRYGVCRDKGALLVSMLRIAGYKAFPVLINVGAKMDPDVPKPYFNHAIVAVEENGQYVLMDPTCENTKDIYPSYLSNCSYLVARPEGETILTSPVPPGERNLVEVSTQGELRGDGTLVLKSNLAFNGVNDTIYRGALVRATPEQRFKFFENRLRAIRPGAELIRCDIAPQNMMDTSVPITVELLAKMPEAVLRGETEDVLVVPFVSRAFSVANWLIGSNVSLDKRRYPLVLDTTARVREHLEIDLGGNLGEMLYLPDALTLTNGYAFARSFAMKDGKLVADRLHGIDAVEFSPEGYAQLREDMTRVEAAERRCPTFSADSLKNANVNWLLESTDVDVADDASWTVTNTIVKQVLTYRGKKDSAELSFAYNPTCERVEILSACVSNLNGVVSQVKPSEMNELDCGWAAAAPRYPAGKTLIVNLPAVEVGSVISVTSARTVTNAPAPYYGVIGFDSKEPLVRRRARLNDWARDVVSPRRVPDEPSQPASYRWRDVKLVTYNDFAKQAEVLRKATDVDDLECPECGKTIEAIRNWMAQHVRLAGPSLYEVPIACQLTDPKTVLAERYATRLDYIRTLCALLKGAGYEADIVFAARNAASSPEARRRDMYDIPNVRAFRFALCRVHDNDTTYFLGTENEYNPLGASEFVDCDFFDPETATFDLVKPSSPDYEPRATTAVRMTVHEDGSVDYGCASELYGAGVGGFRKHYAEILPEDFSRHYQDLLSGISKAARATGELKPDVKGYPATLQFSCFLPDYATVEGGMIALRLPSLACPVPALPDTLRLTPIALGAQNASVETLEIRFPKGYDCVECIPEDFAFADPLSPQTVLLKNTVTRTMEGGCLVVRIMRETSAHPNAFFGSEYAGLFRDWRRRATSLASRTIIVRKGAAQL